MEKLSRLRVSPEWAVALAACLDEPPRARGALRGWVVVIGIALAGAVGGVVYFIY